MTIVSTDILFMTFMLLTQEEALIYQIKDYWLIILAILIINSSKNDMVAYNLFMSNWEIYLMCYMM